MIKKITEAELNGLRNWIYDYACANDYRGYTRDDIASNEKLFKNWSAAKSEYLSKLLGGELIIKEEIEYIKPYNELWNEYHKEYYNGEILRPFLDRVLEDMHIKFGRSHTGRQLMSITNPQSLIKNKWEGDTIVVPNPNSKTEIKVERGGKVLKFIRKYCEAYGIDGYDEFITTVSKITNQKKLRGNLCLSIHPLDYLTMSDNEAGWSSCMSWRENGCYRQGTVEMMNSPCVVVAYLESNSGKLRISDDFEWNSKKWRSLYIVDRDIISNVLSYPYENEEFDKIFLAKIRSLAEQNLGWTYEENLSQFDTYCTFKSAGDIDGLEFCPSTEFMYNDLDNNGNHCLAYIRKDIESGTRIDINYSGVDQCMICGDTHSIECEGVVCCDQHDSYVRCVECGCRLDADYTYWVGDDAYCEDCYNNLEACVRCEDTLSPGSEYYLVTEDKHNNITYHCLCYHCYHTFKRRIQDYLIDATDYRRENQRMYIKFENLTKDGKEFLYLN